MKKFLPIILLISACSHFQSNQQKAETTVKEFLDSTLNDPKSYESVKFTPIKADSSQVRETAEYKTYEDSVTNKTIVISGLRTNLSFHLLYDSKETKQSIQKAITDSIFWQKKMDSLESIFKPKKIGFVIINTYRAKNAFGALGLHNTVLLLDTNLLRVVQVIDNN